MYHLINFWTARFKCQNEKQMANSNYSWNSRCYCAPLIGFWHMMPNTCSEWLTDILKVHILTQQNSTVSTEHSYIKTIWKLQKYNVTCIVIFLYYRTRSFCCRCFLHKVVIYTSLFARTFVFMTAFNANTSVSFALFSFLSGWPFVFLSQNASFLILWKHCSVCLLNIYAISNSAKQLDQHQNTRQRTACEKWAWISSCVVFAMWIVHASTLLLQCFCTSHHTTYKCHHLITTSEILLKIIPIVLNRSVCVLHFTVANSSTHESCHTHMWIWGN